MTNGAAEPLNRDDLDDRAKQVHDAWLEVRDELLAQRNTAGHWPGELSSSALATATAISALAEYRRNSQRPVNGLAEIESMIDQGCHWLLNRQNADGGWGDTDASHSNVATSMLVVAALRLAGKTTPAFQKAVDHANGYIDSLGRVQALRDRYGKDKTFAVPILANCAIAGLVPWKEVSALPFEAVLVPQRFFRFINLPVVSYAIPALVAIGQLKHLKDPTWNPATRLLRKLALKPGLSTLTRMQPGSGGFLEAIPLTCFVAMSLAHSGRADHEVVEQCIRFVADSFRAVDSTSDCRTGTWPIDTNLATWNSTLSVNALVGEASAVSQAENTDSHRSVLTDELLDWILACQYSQVHPFTGAAPGGWGWSDLTGAVPDADDTPGALLAIRKWFDHPDATEEQKHRIRKSAKAGVEWLLNLQNRDRGWPTFCRGWGRLPFDRSGNDITAHAIRSLLAWQDQINEPRQQARIQSAIDSGFEYLKKHALPEGGWLPLWFGNQDHPEEENPVYGTVKVLLAWIAAGKLNEPVVKQAVAWLLKNQNDDFGWGGGPSNLSSAENDFGDSGTTSSLQESALALEALTRLLNTDEFAGNGDLQSSVTTGTDWILSAIRAGKTSEKWPIGFYFAKLWYYEKLYPLVFCASAMQTLDCHYHKNSGVAETNDRSASTA